MATETRLDWKTVKDLDKQYMRVQLARAGKPRPEAIGVFFPLCIVERLKNKFKATEYFSANKTQIVEISQNKISYKVMIESNGHIKPPKCRGCAYYSDCRGVYREYYRLKGDHELGLAPLS